ncbi:MAG TPA: adenylate/guanylate cyclase domain-containing protein [Usitatibacter sp.]|jgi:class 3 adenylate cyclase
MLDQANRTFICSVVFIDLVGYSKKPVTEQIRLKTSLTSNLSEAIQDIPVNDRIILDTGDGAAISFLGDPEDALFVTLSLRERILAEGMTATIVEASGEDSVRMGINLGPVKLVKDINGHPNIIGDGINVAQRIMSFARPGQIVVSRSYYDVVSNLASEYAKLFHYEGSRTDKHVREHEIYVVGHNEGALQKAKDGMKDRASSTTPNAKKAASATGSTTVTLNIPSFVQDKKKLTIVAGALAALVLVLGILVIAKKPAPGDVAQAPVMPASELSKTLSPAPGTEPAKSDAAKPDAKVLEPTPPSAAIPAPAPPEAAREAPKDAGKDASKEPPKDTAKDAKKDDDKSKARAADAAKADASKTETPKSMAPPATLVFAVQPWGEIFVNGKSRGVSPPMKSIKLDPGKYKIEVRNSTFPTYTENYDLKARDEITVRHKFQ